MLREEHGDFSELQLGREASEGDVITSAVTGVLAVFAPRKYHPSLRGGPTPTHTWRGVERDPGTQQGEAGSV